jgi:FkbM family methyltransferase
MESTSAKHYKVRGKSILVDTEFESSLGIYGEPFWQGVSSGEYESLTFDFIEQLYKNGFRYFLDVGAATGCMSLYAASTGLSVIAVEPQELVYEALSKNIYLNPDLKSEISVEYALVTGSKTISAIHESFTPGAEGPLAAKSLSTNSLTLQDLIEKCSPSSQVAIKIDIEGAEFPLLHDEATLEYLAKRKPLIYIALHPGFKKPLAKNPRFIHKFLWRIQAAQDIISFYFGISKVASISVASKKNKVKLAGLFYALSRDKKDYILTF